jgi:hypothetical protein
MTSTTMTAPGRVHRRDYGRRVDQEMEPQPQLARVIEHLGGHERTLVPWLTIRYSWRGRWFPSWISSMAADEGGRSAEPAPHAPWRNVSDPSATSDALSVYV